MLQPPTYAMATQSTAAWKMMVFSSSALIQNTPAYLLFLCIDTLFVTIYDIHLNRANNKSGRF